MINIAERLKAEAQVKNAGSENAASSALPAEAKVQTDSLVAAYPAKNLVLDGGRYFVANREK